MCVVRGGSGGPFLYTLSLNTWHVVADTAGFRSSERSGIDESGRHRQTGRQGVPHLQANAHICSILQRDICNERFQRMTGFLIPIHLVRTARSDLREVVGSGGGLLETQGQNDSIFSTSQARYSECCATVHRRCQRCSGLGVVGRVSSLPRVICTRHVSIPPRPLAAARLPLVGQALLSAGGVHRRWAYTLGAEAQVTYE